MKTKYSSKPAFKKIYTTLFKENPLLNLNDDFTFLDNSNKINYS